MSIIVKNLVKKYGRNTVLDNFSYQFNQGGVYALVGESGGGKTTLIKILAGLDKKYSGEVLVFGTVSLAFQEHRLIPTLSLIDNLLVGAFENPGEDDRRKCADILRRFNFTDAEMELYPHQLSGGMKQRASLSRALLFPHDILLLDEPAKELDEKNREVLYEIINEEAKNKLVILSTHSSETIEKTCAVAIQITKLARAE